MLHSAGSIANHGRQTTCRPLRAAPPLATFAPHREVQLADRPAVTRTELRPINNDTDMIHVSRRRSSSQDSHNSFALEELVRQERPSDLSGPDGPASTSESAAVQNRRPRRKPAPLPPSTGPVTAELLADHAGMFCSLLYEYEYWVDQRWIEGELPRELSGTYFRNGPGLQINNERCQRHMFDGDGMLMSLAFKDGRAFFQNKFVRTEGFVAEQAAGKLLMRNSFTRGAVDGSPLWNPLDLRFKNVANTNALYWAGRLFALWEVGMPYELRPTSLETVGEGWFGGRPAAGRIASHYRTVTEADGTSRLVTFSTDVALSGLVVTFYEYSESGEVLHQTAAPLRGVDPTFVHDMLVTEHYYVLVLGAIRFDMGRFVTEYVGSKCSIAECLKYDRSLRSKVMLFPRPGRPDGQVRPAQTMETKPFFSFHHVNAYEVDRTLVVDTIALYDIALDVTQYSATPEHFTGGPRSEYHRLVCDLDSGTVSATQLVRRTLEFPVINPTTTGKPNRHVYLAADTVDHSVLWGPGQAVLKLTLPEGAASPSDVEQDMWYPGPRQCVAEPMFVPRSEGGSGEEDDGWIISVVHNADTMKADIHILDAACLSAGPVCTIHLPHHLPAGLHGAFTPDYLGPDPNDTARPKWKQPNKIKQL